MKLDNETITGGQLTFAIGAFILGSSLLTSFVLSVSAQDSWLMVLISTLISFLIYWMYIVLSQKFPGKDLIEINDEVFGSIVGKIISLFYLYFFFSLAALNTKDVGNFVSGYVLPESPGPVVLVMFVFICAWAVRKGVSTMLRYGFLFTIMSVLFLGFSIIFLIKDMHFGNFLPFLHLPIATYLQSINIITIIPFCEIVVFFMIFPHIDQPKKLKKSVLFGLLIGATMLFLIIARDTAVLGNTTNILSMPSYESVRIINISNVITRTEILFAIAFLVLLFFKISIIYYAIVITLARIFKLRTYRPIVYVTGIIIIVYALITFDSPMENAFWGSNVAPIFSSLFEVLLPLITLIIAQIRGFQKPKEAVAR
ncbi:MAG: hypothetical protein BGN88_08075 [Clostridiales bacterium 43-6]|nr:MAG: hypothetical protein BGN88_08075 [Clostridiales bacterium 43-6]